MKPFIIVATMIFLAALAPFNAMATPFGDNITLSDKNGAGTGWHGVQEDDEVEPGMASGQGWDLEGFFLNGTTLTMVGGFDFINGNSGYNSGDIFIDIGNNAVFGDIHGPQTGNGNYPVYNTFGYDYVLDLNFMNFTYNVYAIDTTALVETAYYKENQGSSPWRYGSGGIEIARDIAFAYLTGGEANTLGFSGNGNHNAVSVSLAFLQDKHHGTDFISHFTMGCGNDNLMGQGRLPTPEPATVFLVGCGLIGLAGIGRKKQKVDQLTF